MLLYMSNFKNKFKLQLHVDFQVHNKTKDRYYDFKNIFAKEFSENIGVFCSNYC
jgi:hypothetical protein